jgi:hypothetical protein
MRLTELLHILEVPACEVHPCTCESGQWGHYVAHVGQAMLDPHSLGVPQHKLQVAPLLVYGAIAVTRHAANERQGPTVGAAS